jgi:ATP-dependent Lhr-like helicase
VRRGSRFSVRQRRGAAAQIQGRWSLTTPLLGDGVEPTARRRAWAELLLERYGVLTREQVLAEGVPGGFSALHPELSQLETLGTARRGYFVEGLGGAQFALPGAVERLRSERADDPAPVVLSAVDPAQPYGAALRWPRQPHDAGAARKPAKTARLAGAHVVLIGGEPILYLERGGRSLQTLVRGDDARLEPALAALVERVRSGQIRRLALEKVDGQSALGSPLTRRLVALGFQEGPRRMTLSA